MKSYTKTPRRLVILALLCWALQGMALAQLPASTKNTELDKELDIFGAVIKDSLTEKGVVKALPAGKTIGFAPGMPMGAPGFIGRSPFDWTIRSQYVPTVGVIYTIPVPFPLVNPEKKVKKPEPSTTKPENQDLWEKNEKDIEGGPQTGASPRAITPGGVGQAGPGTENAMGFPTFQGANTMFGPMGPMGMGVPPAPPYDAEKVKSLRSALIDILAEYGYRLKDLPENEKILFIVTSSGTTAGGGPSIFIKSAGSGMAKDILISHTAEESSSADQYLLSIKKAELAEKCAPDQIEPKLTERLF